MNRSHPHHPSAHVSYMLPVTNDEDVPYDFMFGTGSMALLGPMGM